MARKRPKEEVFPCVHFYLLHGFLRECRKAEGPCVYRPLETCPNFVRRAARPRHAFPSGLGCDMMAVTGGGSEQEAGHLLRGEAGEGA